MGKSFNFKGIINTSTPHQQLWLYPDIDVFGVITNSTNPISLYVTVNC